MRILHKFQKLYTYWERKNVHTDKKIKQGEVKKLKSIINAETIRITSKSKVQFRLLQYVIVEGKYTYLVQSWKKKVIPHVQ